MLACKPARINEFALLKLAAYEIRRKEILFALLFFVNRNPLQSALIGDYLTWAVIVLRQGIRVKNSTASLLAG